VYRAKKYRDPSSSTPWPDYGNPLVRVPGTTVRTTAPAPLLLMLLLLLLLLSVIWLTVPRVTVDGRGGLSTKQNTPCVELANRGRHLSPTRYMPSLWCT
jgi:hypothetical protein